MIGIFLFLICVLRPYAAEMYDTKVLINLTSIVADHYYSPCIKLIHKNILKMEESKQLFDVFKAFSLKLKSTIGIYSYNQYMEIYSFRENQQTFCNKPIKFVIGGEDFKEDFAMLSKNSSLSKALWLITLNSTTSSFFQDARLPFDVEIIVARIKNHKRIEFREVYRVDDNYPLRMVPCGLWTFENGLQMVSGSLYSRRSNLEGKLLKTGSIENWPMSSFKDNTWDGYFPRIWKELEKMINCTTKSFKSIDNSTGALKSNGNWTGLVGMAVKGDIDVIVSEITINADRSKFLTFSRPVLLSKYQVFFCGKGTKLKWSAVLNPLALDTWLTVSAWVVLGTITLSFCYYYSQDNEDEEKFTPLVSFFFILQSLCQQGYPTIPKQLSRKIIFFTSYILSAILIPSYSASLIYSLTHHTQSKPFSSLAEFYTDGSYDLNLIKNTAQEAYLKKSSNHLYQKIYNRIKDRNSLVPTLKAGLKKTFCKNRQAFFGVQDIVNMHLHQYFNPPCCTVMTLSQPLAPVFQCLAFPKNSPYSGLINSKLQKMFTAGIIQNIKNYFKNQYLKHGGSYGDVEVEIKDVFQIFFLLFVGILLSSVFFLLERIFWKRQELKNSKNSQNDN